MRLETDEAADRGRGAFAHGDAHPVGLDHHAAGVDRAHAHHDAVAARALLARLDEAGDGRAPGRERQHRMGDAQRRERGGSKSGGDCRKAERERKSDRAAAREDRNRDAGERQRAGRPPGRLALGGEIEDDAEAESDRQPRHQSPGRNFRQRPLRQHAPQAIGRAGEPIRQHEPRAPARGVDLRRPGLGACSTAFAVCHGAPDAGAYARGPCYVSQKLWLGERL